MSFRSNRSGLTLCLALSCCLGTAVLCAEDEPADKTDAPAAEAVTEDRKSVV